MQKLLQAHRFSRAAALALLILAQFKNVQPAQRTSSYSATTRFATLLCHKMYTKNYYAEWFCVRVVSNDKLQ